MDLTPTTREELAEALAVASDDRRTVAVRGGGTESRRGRPWVADDSVCTLALNRVVDYAPADMIITVEGGALATDVAALIGAKGQRWASADIRPGATVGGILSAARTGKRRLRQGAVRDSLMEVVVATGDGRLVVGGGRTVKLVTGFDLPRLMVGSLGTLGVIVQATLKLWPDPMASSWFTAEGDTTDMLALANDVLAAYHRPAAVIVRPGAMDACIEGAPEDVVAPDGARVSVEPANPEGVGLVEMGVPPAALAAIVRRLDQAGEVFEAWMGTGICRVAVADAREVASVRALAVEFGGHAQILDGPDDLRADPFGPVPPGAEVMRRMRAAFDPAGILNPGLFAAEATA
ncbi:MAG: FAD-binding oxidoreductase [Miltoncostaeaceae bacterium]